MVKVAVVYHSGYGHTKKQTEAVVSGASGAGATVQLIPVADIDMHWEYLAQADAIIFGALTYMGSLSAEFKKFMDVSSKPWYQMLRRPKVTLIQPPILANA